MRILILATTLLLTPGSEPVVVQQVVDIRGGYDKPRKSKLPDAYIRVLDKVNENAGKVFMVVGEKTVTPNDGRVYDRVPSFKDVEDGVYECWLENGQQLFIRIPVDVSSPVSFQPTITFQVRRVS